MTDSKKLRGRGSAMRQRAEDRIGTGKAVRSVVPSPEDAPRLIHDLRVHQLGLERENEKLRRTQEEIEASRVRYFDLYELAPVGYLTLNETGLIVEANLAVAGLLGVAKAALLQQPLTRFIHSEDQETFYRFRKQREEGGTPKVSELRMLRADNPLLWVRLEANTWLDMDGALLCHLVISDVTERKLAEESLLASEGKHRLFSECSGDAIINEDQSELICRYRTDGRLSFVNGAYARYYGKSQSDFINRNFTPEIPEPDLSMIATRLAGITRENPITEFEHRILLPSGEVCWQHWTHRGIFADDGLLIEYQAVGRDITERKQIEEALLHLNEELETRVQLRTEELQQALRALQDSEEKFRTVADFAYDWEYWRDPEGKFLYVSPSCESISGYPSSAFLRDPDLILRITHPEDLPRMEAHFQEIQSVCTELEFRIVARDGEIHWIGHACQQPGYHREDHCRAAPSGE